MDEAPARGAAQRQSGSENPYARNLIWDIGTNKEHTVRIIQMGSVTRPRVVAVATALARLQELAARAASPARMAREVQIILREWSAEESDLLAVSSRKTDFLSKLENGVADAEGQLADVDREDRAALLQAETTLAALTACREAAANDAEALPI